MRFGYGQADCAEWRQLNDTSECSLPPAYFVHVMIVSTAVDAWQLGAGDPTILDWMITLGYLTAAFLCIRRGRAQQATRRIRLVSQHGNSVTPWYLLSGGTLILGLNKELDLQSLLVQLARAAALSEGWYDLRRTVQKWFVLLLAAAVTVVGGWLLRRYLYFVQQHMVLSAGFAVVICYALLRACEFNHLSWVAGLPASEHGPFWPLEICGVGLMLFGLLRVEGAGQLSRNDPHAS